MSVAAPDESPKIMSARRPIQCLLIMLTMVCALSACGGDDDACDRAKEDALRHGTLEYIEKAEKRCLNLLWVGGLETTYARTDGREHTVRIPYPEAALRDGFIDVGDVRRLLNNKTGSDIERIYQDLFGRTSLPDEVPMLLDPDVPDDHPYKSFLPEEMRAAVRVDVYRSDIEYPQREVYMLSRHVMYEPLTDEPPDKVAILLQGHDNAHLMDQVRFFLERGFAVISRGMPRFLDDHYITIGGEPFQGGHDDLYDLEGPDFNPLALFIEPNILAVNLAAHAHPGAKIYTVGLSGGALMALLTHALDGRISASVSVSGWKPFFLRYRVGLKDFEGDYEQHTSRFYYTHALNFLDLVHLATRSGGRHYQVWVTGDTSTFGGDGYTHYAYQLSKVTQGKYSLILDPVSIGHSIKDFHLESFLTLELEHESD